MNSNPVLTARDARHRRPRAEVLAEDPGGSSSQTQSPEGEEARHREGERFRVQTISWTKFILHLSVLCLFPVLVFKLFSFLFSSYPKRKKSSSREPKRPISTFVSKRTDDRWNILFFFFFSFFLNRNPLISCGPDLS